MSQSCYRSVILRGSLFVLLFVLAPNIAYMGHWGVGATATHAHANGQTHSSAHAQHCHEGASQCDHPATVSVSWVTGESRDERFADSPLIAVPYDEAIDSAEGAVDVTTPPPRLSV